MSTATSRSLPVSEWMLSNALSLTAFDGDLNAALISLALSCSGHISMQPNAVIAIDSTANAALTVSARSLPGSDEINPNAFFCNFMAEDLNAILTSLALSASGDIFDILSNKSQRYDWGMCDARQCPNMSTWPSAGNRGMLWRTFSCNALDFNLNAATIIALESSWCNF